MRLRMVGEAGDEMAGVRPTGHLQVKGGAAKRRYYALWRDADGRHQQLLGPAYVKDSRRRTPRGAIIWRSGDGLKPDPSFLTPPELSLIHICAWDRVLLASRRGGFSEAELLAAGLVQRSRDQPGRVYDLSLIHI